MNHEDETRMNRQRESAAFCTAPAVAPETFEDQHERALYDEAVALMVANGRVSISLIQRQLRLGFSVAARLIDRMEANGIVSAPDGPFGRRVLCGAKEPKR